MRKQTKKVLFAITALLVSFPLLAGLWIVFNSRDIPTPDTSDLAYEKLSVPNKDNAYIYFKKAKELYNGSDTELDQVRAILNGETWDDKLFANLLSKNNEALTLIQKGLRCSIYQRTDNPKLEKFKSLVKLFKIAELMALKTMRERQTMQIEMALESSLDLLRLSSLVISNPGSSLEYLLGMEMLRLGLDEIRQLLDEPSLTEVQLARLFKHLKSISPLNEGLIIVIKVDFNSVSKMILDFDSKFKTKNSIKHKFFRRYCFQPNRSKREFAIFCRKMIKNASQSYAEIDLPENNSFESDLRTFIHTLQPNGFAKMVLPYPGHLNSFIKGKIKSQTQLTAIHLVVACRIYEIKHGHLPNTLRDLVPEFFDDIPHDPFDDKPFKYLPKQAVVYSVGKNQDHKIDKKPKDLIYDIHSDSEYISPVKAP